jgi:hypothetical protein
MMLRLHARIVRGKKIEIKMICVVPLCTKNHVFLFEGIRSFWYGLGSFYKDGSGSEIRLNSRILRWKVKS